MSTGVDDRFGCPLHHPYDLMCLNPVTGYACNGIDGLDELALWASGIFHVDVRGTLAHAR